MPTTTETYPVSKVGDNKRTWKEFQDSGLLWWVNRTLHLFGWAIVLEVAKGKEIKEIIDVYPIRTSSRGFNSQGEANGFRKLTQHFAEEAPKLLAQADGT